MKVCISLRDNAPANLRDGNLRSEGRWERQALEASLQNPAVSEVYTVGCNWEGNHPKYKGPLHTPNDVILLMQDWNSSVIRHDFKAAVVNIFSGPWLEQIPEVQSAFSRLRGNLFFTMGFPIMYRNELNAPSRSGHETVGLEVDSHLAKFVPRENILLLPVPGAPYITEGSSFDKTSLLWVSRLVFISQMANSQTLLWSLKKLEQDPSLNLEVVTGWFPEEVKDYVDGQVVYRNNITESFWAIEAFAPFVGVRDRVQIHLHLDWAQIISKYNQAKLLTMYGRMFGGPPLEAGMHGVPFVGMKNTGALGDCSEYVYAEDEAAACLLLEKLLNDRDFYTTVSNSYREYVRDHYTFDAFNNNLNSLLRDRNLI